MRVSAVCPGFVETAIFENAIGVKNNKSEMLERLRLPLMPAEAAARAILRGVERNRGVIVFAGSARWIWRLSRIDPTLLTTLGRRMIRAMREKTPGGI